MIKFTQIACHTCVFPREKISDRALRWRRACNSLACDSSDVPGEQPTERDRVLMVDTLPGVNQPDMYTLYKVIYIYICNVCIAGFHFLCVVFKPNWITFTSRRKKQHYHNAQLLIRQPSPPDRQGSLKSPMLLAMPLRDPSSEGTPWECPGPSDPSQSRDKLQVLLFVALLLASPLVLQLVFFGGGWNGESMGMIHSS